MTKQLIVAAALAALAITAHAQNKGGSGSTSSGAGVITIDQARVEAGGVTPGDAPGFPVTISQPGSYRLAGNLAVPTLQTAGIVITASDVTLDLGGFVIRGPLACVATQAADVCPGSYVEGADGIRLGASNTDVVRNVQVSGGTIRGMGGHGVNALVFDGGHTFEYLRVIGNGGHGIFLRNSAVSHSHFIGNRMTGITGFSGSAMHNRAERNNTGLAMNGLSMAGYNYLYANGTNFYDMGSLGRAVQVAPNLCNGVPCQ